MNQAKFFENAKTDMDFLYYLELYDAHYKNGYRLTHQCTADFMLYLLNERYFHKMYIGRVCN